MPTPYPLRFQPFYRDYLWGGRKLQTVLGKELPPSGIWAESWEIVDHPEHSSQICNGPLRGKSLSQLTLDNRQWLLGDDEQHQSLPLLLKYLDCQRVLSVQVHPDDQYATLMSPPDLGKTEAWVIISAESDAVLYAGLKAGVTHQALRQALVAGQVEECLHAIYPQCGDCVFIPAGTVHALGAGLLVAEIQQASNTTFRLFDWNRVDANGQPRPLHIDQSLEVIDFDSGPRPLQTAQPTDLPGRQRLVSCDKFVLDRLQTMETSPDENTHQLAGDGRLHLVTVPTGEATFVWNTHAETVTCGQSLLLPASMDTLAFQLAPGTMLLDMYLPSVC